MGTTSFQSRLHKMTVAAKWRHADRSNLRNLSHTAEVFILYLRGPLMLATGFLLGSQVAAHWAKISLQVLGY